MAKKSANTKPLNKGLQTPVRPSSSKGGNNSSPAGSSLLSHPYLPYLIIILFSTGIYFNTLWNQYAIDDTMLIADNKFTDKGFAGIKDIMTHDAFEGYWGEMGTQIVSGGRYRPLSIVTFAIEVQLLGKNPMVSHAINVVLFTLTCILLYYLLLYMLPPPKKGTPFYFSIPFIATMMFAGHPIHTEVVANIKGRDEIMSLLFSLWALLAAVQYVKTQKIAHLALGAFVFFLALLSKENAATFFFIIFLTYYFLTSAKLKDYALTAGLYIIPLAIFLFMRATFTKSGLTTESTEILNNPFAYLPAGTDGLIQRYATIIMVFLMYIGKLILPHPLSHDYYYNQIPIIGAFDPKFILSLIVNAALFIYAIWAIHKKSLPSYAILFYYITFSVVSNLVFQIGNLFNERFVYMSSIGFCLLIAYLLVKTKERYSLSSPVVIGLLSAVLILYSVKTISRNRVWVDSPTLFLTDVKTNPNSAKVQLAAGGDLSKLAEANFDSLRRIGRLQYWADMLDLNMDISTVPDTTFRKIVMDSSIRHLRRSLEIYPTRPGAWTMLGMVIAERYKRDSSAAALLCYENAEKYGAGADYDAWYNMGTIKVNTGRSAEAKEDLTKAVIIKPESFVATYNLGLAYYNLSKPDSALLWFKKALALKPQDGLTNYAIGTIYGKVVNQPDSAIHYLEKAIQYSPTIPGYYDELFVAYDRVNRLDDAIRIAQQCAQSFPGYNAPLMSIANEYMKKGDTQKAQEYTAKFMQLSAQKK